MSLWAEYHKERLGQETIEVDGGFVSYILNPPEASIEELYVRPAHRGTPLAKRLADQVVKKAKEAGAKRLWAKVVCGALGAEHSLTVSIKYGFRLATTRGNDIILVKDLEEKSGKE